jgi:DNA processing protein
MNELQATLTLSYAPFLGPIRIRTLLEQYGSACEVLRKAPSLKFRQETYDFLTSSEAEHKCQKELESAAQMNVRIVTYKEEGFPKRLKGLSDCPPLIYLKGHLPDPNLHWISIVGTRASTEYANEVAEQYSRTLSSRGCVIVSGLARGIDTYAHQGCLPDQTTVAVLGSGLNHIYPKENDLLAHEISKKGALLSEYPMNQRPTLYTFPKRNRLIAALSDVIILVEAPLKSGAMITMKEGKKQGKRLYVIPSDTKTAAGNLLLISKKRLKSSLAQKKFFIILKAGKKNSNPLFISEEALYIYLSPI